MTDIVYGHVEMTIEEYNRLDFDQRTRRWRDLINGLNIPNGTPWLPVRYLDRERMIVGMNIVGLKEVDDDSNPSD